MLSAHTQRDLSAPSNTGTGWDELWLNSSCQIWGFVVGYSALRGAAALFSHACVFADGHKPAALAAVANTWFPAPSALDEISNVCAECREKYWHLWSFARL